MSDLKTDAKIIKAAQGLLEKEGFGAVSFDTVARSLGITKQSVLYWFPSKSDLLASMFLDWLNEETDEVVACLKSAQTQDEAINVFVRTVTRFHTSNIDRYRMMYLAPQTLKAGMQEARNSDVLDRIHETTSKLYEALTDQLEGRTEKARQTAFAIHSAALGLVLMLGLAEGIGDPLKHSEEELVSALIDRLTTKQ